MTTRILVYVDDPSSFQSQSWLRRDQEVRVDVVSASTFRKVPLCEQIVVASQQRVLEHARKFDSVKLIVSMQEVADGLELQAQGTAEPKAISVRSFSMAGLAEGEPVKWLLQCIGLPATPQNLGAGIPTSEPLEMGGKKRVRRSSRKSDTD